MYMESAVDFLDRAPKVLLRKEDSNNTWNRPQIGRETKNSAAKDKVALKGRTSGREREAMKEVESCKAKIDDLHQEVRDLRDDFAIKRSIIKAQTREIFTLLGIDGGYQQQNVRSTDNKEP